MGSLKAMDKAFSKLQLELDLSTDLGMVPWYNYRVTLPELPLPPVSERPTIHTKNLIVRPIRLEDLEQFYELRKLADLQQHSKQRGRADASIDESRQYIEALIDDDNCDHHWYFGAFLRATGELIGEGGLPDCRTMATSASGWPEAEFLIKPEHQRKGYGSELFQAVMDSWWTLPRERRRHQLIGLVVPGKEPGDKVEPEGVVFQWEDGNQAAKYFFSKMLDHAPVSAEGAFESIDRREGREGSLVKWVGMLAARPPMLPTPPDESDEEYDEYSGGEEEEEVEAREYEDDAC